MAKDSNQVEQTKRLMGALMRMKPKPHEDMKVGKTSSAKKRKSQRKKAAKRNIQND